MNELLAQLRNIPLGMKLKRGLSSAELAQVERQLLRHIPSDIRQLLEYSSGLEIPAAMLKLSLPPKSDERLTLDFTPSSDFGFEEAVPRAIPLMNDGFGNFWIVDVDADTGSWGAVLFACHDPAVLVVQSYDLSAFLRQLLRPHESEPRDALSYVKNTAVTEVFKHNPFAVPVTIARNSADPAIRGFASHLPDTFDVVDLRSRDVGSGFAWSHASSEQIQRDGSELLFGVVARSATRSKSFIRRLLGS